MIRILLIYILVCFSFYAQGQAPASPDSAGFYRNIENYAKKRKFTKWIHRLIFRPVPAIASKTVRKEQKKLAVDPYYRKFEDKVIRNIEIVSLDPFGYALRDTLKTPNGFLKKTGNTLHNKTAAAKIRHMLLFREGDTFDSLLVRDSERLIRSQKYIRDVMFTCMRVGKSDSVDIYIRSLDVWSIIVEGSLTASRFSPDITERNFMGLGHRLEYQYNGYYDEGGSDMAFSYSITNIYRSFANAGLYYFRNTEGGRVGSITLDRPFYSVFAKWAGGIYLARQQSLSPAPSEDSLIVDEKVSSIQQDYWIGHAWQLFKGKTADVRTTNLILSFRYANLYYTDHPVLQNDTLNVYSTDRFYLGGIGISTRKYVSDKFVFKYGDGEDIPTGRVYGIVSGYRVHGNETDWYLGMRLSWGNYYSWGYFSYALEYGTFTNIKRFNQGVMNFDVNYFTELIEVGRWKFRQFVKPQLTIGINRTPSERISLNDDSGIRGFDSPDLTGVKRFLITFQTQSYAPWNVFGFRFGPYLILSAGMLAEEKQNFSGSRLYTQFGLGVLIKNEYLVLNTFQVSVAFYPIIPGDGTNVFKINPVKTTDYLLSEFDFSRPSMLVYR